MSSVPQRYSGARSSHQDINSSTESWIVIGTNGSEREYSSFNLEGSASVGATAHPESARYAQQHSQRESDRDKSLEVLRAITNSNVMEPLRNFGKWIARGLEASKKYNLPLNGPSQQPPPVPPGRRHQSEQRHLHVHHQPAQSQQRPSHKQPTTQHQPHQKHSHERLTTQHQTPSHKQPTTQHQSQQRPPHKQPTTQHQTPSHKQPTTQHQSQQRPPHKQPTTQHQSQQRPSHQQSAQHKSHRHHKHSHHHQQPAQSRHKHSHQKHSSQQPVQHQTQQKHSHQHQHQPQPPPTQHCQEPVQTSAVTLPSELIGKIIYHHPVVRQQLEDVVEAEFASLTWISSDYTAVCVSGTQVCDLNAAFQVEQMVDRIKMRLTDELLQLHPMFFPVLVDPEVVEIIKDIQEENLVEIELLQSSDDPVRESFNTLAQQWDASHPTKCIRVSELKEYTSLCAPVSTGPHYEWWVWDDSRGSFVAFSHEVNQHLNDCYSNQKLDRTEYMYKGKHYIVDFKTNTFTEVSSGIVQQLNKRLQPILWSYSIDPFHVESVPYQPSDSQAIEHMYHYGGYHMKLAGIRYTFDFDPKSMTQIDLLTGEKVCLQRCPMPEISTPPQHSITVRIRGLPENVSSAKNELEGLLQASTETKEDNQLLQMFHPEHRKTVLAHLSNAIRQYCVMFTSSQQDENGPTCIQIQGHRSYVTGIHNDSISQCLITQKFIAATTQQFHPLKLVPLATSTKKTGPDFELKNVPPQSPEWNGVLKMMQQTMPAVRIQSLQQVNHRYQWDRYQLEMTHMKRNGTSVNEWYLFHGTRQSDPMEVVQSDRGFDFRCSREDCLWGSGVYFAANASYSDRYHHQASNSNFKQIILARVLTGRSRSYCQTHDKTLRKPPELPSGTGFYDTVNGYTYGSFVYVVYDHSKSYPAYIITYE